MAPQLEEIVVDAHSLQRQDLGEQPAQDLLLGMSAERGTPLRVAPAPARPVRSSLPLGVSGKASSTTNAAGTMYSGRPLPQVATQGRRLERDAPGRAPRRPPAACPPGRRRAPPPPPAPPPGALRSAASISPGSMRKPRIFT